MYRKKFLQLTTASLAGLSIMPGLAFGSTFQTNPICIFSKCLQFLDYHKLGEVVAQIGFDSVDLTVRKGGHVEPRDVLQDLPRAVKALKKSGINVSMIVTDITDGKDEFANNVLATASDLGIGYYRMGYFTYNANKEILADLDDKKRKIESILRINRQYEMKAGYQNHSGPWGMVGGAVWDLYYLLKDFEPEFIGVQYDIAHATAEGGYAWEIDLKVIKPWINSLAIKDFVWQKGEKRWETKWVPLGVGMVDFNKYSEQVKSLISKIPVTIHFEYDFGGAEHGKLNTVMSHDEIYRKLAKDLHYFKNKIRTA